MKRHIVAAGIVLTLIAVVLSATSSASVALSGVANTSSIPRNFMLTLTIVSPFQTAVSVEVDNEGNIHVADITGIGRIWKFSPSGALLLDYPMIQGRIINPSGIGLGPRDYIYVADTDHERILIYRAGDGHEIGGWNDIGQPFSFYEPWGVAGADYAGGTVFVIDRFYCLLYRFSSNGHYIGSSGGCESTQAYMLEPRDIAIYEVSGAAPIVYVTDTGNNRIKKYDTYPFFIENWEDLDLNTPSSIATDSSGNVYIADTGNNRIVVADGASRYVTEFGANLLNHPLGVAVDHQSGCVVVADTGNNRVLKFCPQKLRFLPAILNN